MNFDRKALVLILYKGIHIKVSALDCAMIANISIGLLLGMQFLNELYHNTYT